MSTVEKKSWGAVDGAVNTDAPAPGLTSKYFPGAGTAPVQLMDFDFSKFQIKPELQEGSSGDKFMAVVYNNQRVSLTFDDLPSVRRSPFACSPWTDKSGNVSGSGAQTIHVEVSQEEYEKLLTLEKELFTRLSPRRDELMAGTQHLKIKNGKPVKRLTEEEFADMFNSQIRPANVEKGWKATLRIGVQNAELNKDGKPKLQPDILTTKLKGELAWTKPKPGTTDDLCVNAALGGVVFEVFRGIYFGNNGWGMRFTLRATHVFTNLSGRAGPAVETSHMTVVPDSDDEDGTKPAPLALKNEAAETRPFQPDTSLDGRTASTVKVSSGEVSD